MWHESEQLPVDGARPLTTSVLWCEIPPGTEAVAGYAEPPSVWLMVAGNPEALTAEQARRFAARLVELADLADGMQHPGRPA